MISGCYFFVRDSLLKVSVAYALENAFNLFCVSHFCVPAKEGVVGAGCAPVVEEYGEC